MRVDTETLMLACKLTDSEIQSYGVQLAEEFPKRKLLEKELRKFKAQVHENILKVNARISELTGLINAQEELRNIECAVKYNFKSGEKYWIRKDTLEIAKKELIPDSELQETLPLEIEVS